MANAVWGPAWVVTGEGKMVNFLPLLFSGADGKLHYLVLKERPGASLKRGRMMQGKQEQKMDSFP